MDFKKQVSRMIAFINQEGDERSVEIDSKTDEEVNSSFGNYINTERIKVNTYYRKLEEAVQRTRIVQVSLLVNQARMKILSLKERKVEALFGEIYFKVLSNLTDQQFYLRLFHKLTLQGLCMMMEPFVGIRIRECDKPLVRHMIPRIIEEFEAMSRLRVKFQVDGRVYLEENTLGGVILYAHAGNIKIENTVRARLAIIRHNSESFIRYFLFGVNHHRKFYE